MKHLLYLTPLPLLLALPASAQFVVIDPTVVEQVIQQVRLTLHQIDQVQTELERLGDPVQVSLDVARQLQDHLSLSGVGRTLEEVQATATGAASLAYDANGLYRAPGAVILTSDGRQTPRIVERYRKFDAVTQAKSTLEEVMRDTEQRRQHLRQQLQQTLGQLQGASTMAEVAKLSGVLSAQNTELAAIDREREAALSRVLVQHIENQTDAARQAVAQREERAAVFRAASGKLDQFLTPNPAPVQIPDSRPARP
jgi:hypothetical protein